MKEVCDLPREAENYAWCFDCVPEENSLLLGFGGMKVEIPSINLVFQHPHELLGEAVHARFGTEFPIRFDFLDTMDGGNLSFQVHPLTESIQQQFGMHYTQDESYYLLDAGEEACVYLGLKENIDSKQMTADLLQAQEGTIQFDADRYINRFPARKHDHFLIPAGTPHCSGKNSMVLEISATPYIFTFKMWDWGRVGLDGTPRPIHLQHGFRNIQWDRTTKWVEKNLINAVTPVATGTGWREERTGLHEREFIETRRHWFTAPVHHSTGGGVNVLNLCEGREAVVESPTGQFPAAGCPLRGNVHCSCSGGRLCEFVPMVLPKGSGARRSRLMCAPTRNTKFLFLPGADAFMKSAFAFYLILLLCALCSFSGVCSREDRRTLRRRPVGFHGQ